MKEKLHLAILYALLAILLFFVCLSLYLSIHNAPSDESAIIQEVEEEYDYNAVQEMVSIPQTPPTKSSPDGETQESEEVSIVTEPVNLPTYDTTEMLHINPDFKGWLWIPDTDVNYPVVQTTNNDTYLSTSFQGASSAFGCLFLDKDCTSSSRSRIIHGHNMGNNRTEMFSSLLNYQDPAWAEERLYAYFIEPNQSEASKYQLFAVLNFSVYDLDEFDYFQTEFASNQEFCTFVSYLMDHSLFPATFEPEGDVLILSTCNNYYGTDNRLLICYSRVSAYPQN